MSTTANTIYLKDYQAPAYLIDTTALYFCLQGESTIVRSCLALRRNPDVAKSESLRLDGQDLELLSVAIDGRVLSAEEYAVDDDSLTLFNLPDECELQCETRIYPAQNKALEGLYRSQTMYCTQCEAEGFRKITYYLDRPDVMSIFTTTIEADAKEFPVLLSNGNLTASDVVDDRRIVTWHDPHRKPCYLFALVAGDLERISDEFVTASGRHVDLHIYVEAKDLDKCAHAMTSLKASMRWDEEVYGREYDLDIFMIVAVDDFNMGAMENKGLNIFNTSCVLANPKTTTDAGFQRVEAVVAHEYFHNWSGNRVTCRDWFQLSLKEGFTVFRDSQFSADMNSATVKRIDDVNLLRTLQFAEDAGPMAHPIQPASFIEISNFYTLTIYEKGAEVVRMLHTLLGPELFRAGSDLYFDRHDGQAVTCEDFVQAMADVSGRDLSVFKHWYSQAGTPELHITDEYDELAQTYTLHLKQGCQPSPGQPEKAPFLIPLKMALIGEAGQLRLQLQDEAIDAEQADNTETVIEFSQSQATYVFTGINERPVPSLLRGFSAPVKMTYAHSREQLLFLMQNDSDGFSRWDASQKLAVAEIALAQNLLVNGSSYNLSDDYLGVCQRLLADESLDVAMLAQMLTLPSEAALAEQAELIDVLAIHQARQTVKQAMAKALELDFKCCYERLAPTQAFAATAAQFASRAMRQCALSYLSTANPDYLTEILSEQFYHSDNMTEQAAALSQLVHGGHESLAELKQQCLDDFYQQWSHEALVVNQWFQVQAADPQSGALHRIKTLMQHPAYDRDNPNKVRALMGGFTSGNLCQFHAPDGSGYEFLADEIIRLDQSNPQLAARMLTPLTRWKRYVERHQAPMRKALAKIASIDNLSKDVFEVAEKSLK